MTTQVSSTQPVDAPESERRKAPFVVTCLASLYLLVGVHEVVVFSGSAIGASSDSTSMRALGPFSELVHLPLAFLLLVVGFGLQIRARWGQTGAVLVAVLVGLACVVGGGLTAVSSVMEPTTATGSSSVLRVAEIGVMYAIMLCLSLLHVAVTIGDEMTRWSRSL